LAQVPWPESSGVAPAHVNGERAVYDVFCPCPEKSPKTQHKGAAMPIISKVPEIVKREFELEDYVLLAVEKYAAFIDSSPDHVVNSALKMIVLKDKEFARWRKEQNTDSKKSPSLVPKAGPKP